MSKGVGLDAGGYEAKVVELDGSVRKPRLTKVSIDPVAPADAGASESERARLDAEAARHALRDAHVARYNVCLAFPCREAVLRDIVVPFTGTDAIRKVIKFEAEGEIHSHSVDDMVVDFRVLEERDKETRVLVAAVPKAALGTLLDALERSGIEPEVVDLDTMALYRVAEWAGCFAATAADAAASDEAGTELPAEAAAAALMTKSRTARLVIDVGSRSTRILAVVDGQLADMRALRVGIDGIAEEIAATAGIDLGEAREAVFSALEHREDFVLPGVDEDADRNGVGNGDANGETAIATARAESVPLAQVELARDRLLLRLRRELLRFFTGLPRVSTIERVFVTGGGSTLAGLHDVLAEVFGCTAEPLDVLSRLNHSLDEKEADWINPRIAVAVGLALGVMGAAPGFNFRQEELTYRRGFDRIKFPLAIACMLGVFLPFIYGMRQYKQLEKLEREYGAVYEIKENKGRRSQSREVVFWGHVGLLMNENVVGRDLPNRDYDTLVNQLVDLPTFKRLPLIRSRLQSYLRQQQESTGIYENLRLKSGVYVLARFAKVIDDLEEDLGSFLVTELELSLPYRIDSQHLTFEVAIRGDEYRTRYERLEEALRREFEDPTSPFADFGKAKGETLFKGSEIPGAYYEVKLDLKEDYLEGAR